MYIRVASQPRATVIAIVAFPIPNLTNLSFTNHNAILMSCKHIPDSRPMNIRIAIVVEYINF